METPGGEAGGKFEGRKWGGCPAERVRRAAQVVKLIASGYNTLTTYQKRGAQMIAALVAVGFLLWGLGHIAEWRANLRASKAYERDLPRNRRIAMQRAVQARLDWESGKTRPTAPPPVDFDPTGRWSGGIPGGF